MYEISNQVNPKYIDYIHIRAAETDFAVACPGRSTAVTEDVNVGKSNMHRHGTEFAPVGIVVKGISNLMNPMASMCTFPVNQGDFDLGFAHDTTP